MLTPSVQAEYAGVVVHELSEVLTLSPMQSRACSRTRVCMYTKTH